jgi:hypothetical protein
MTRFDFLEFFEPQTVFIGEWGMKFIFLDFFYFFDLKWSKKMIKFIFKWSNLYSND